jgi:hypothetical protein
MKLAKDIYRDLMVNFELIETQLKSLQEMQSMLDKELSSTYHAIEIDNFSASEGYNYAKKIQEICQTRRLVKHEIGDLMKLQANLPIVKKVNHDKLRDKCDKYFSNSESRYEEDYYDNFNVTREDVYSLLLKSKEEEIA